MCQDPSPDINLIKGPKGDKGPHGSTGVVGDQGDMGYTGRRVGRRVSSARSSFSTVVKLVYCNIKPSFIIGSTKVFSAKSLSLIGRCVEVCVGR